MSKFAHSRRTTRNGCPVGRVMGVVGVLVAGTLLFLSLGMVPNAGASSYAETANGVTITGRINGQELATSSESNPVRLYPLRPTDIVLTVANRTSLPVHVATVRLSGQVVSLTFFAFDTSVAFAVGPGRTVTNVYSLPLIGLSGQATGLVDGSLSVLNARQQLVGSQGFVADVRGSLNSVYGIFGIVLAVLTAIVLGAVLVSLARRRLAHNRFRRGLTFLVPGIGVGLILVFTLSATRVFVPSPSHWIPLVAVSAAIFFVIGYFTPGPDVDDEDEDKLSSAESLGDSPASAVAGFASARPSAGSTITPSTEPYPKSSTTAGSARAVDASQMPVAGDRATQSPTVVPESGPPRTTVTVPGTPSPSSRMGAETTKSAGRETKDADDQRRHPTVHVEPDSLSDGGV